MFSDGFFIGHGADDCMLKNYYYCLLIKQRFSLFCNRFAGLKRDYFLLIIKLLIGQDV